MAAIVLVVSVDTTALPDPPASPCIALWTFSPPLFFEGRSVKFPFFKEILH